ncbi:hypothetical protein GCM10010371_39640 [Streptomyces subrutilus]|uniref:Zinc-binding dehydrogenase n=1 Tax=Streptomyces subrutilus TaxID=36818 RepID=A0A918QZI5_9ACTN|nr:zinc-binding dehydrogenase [Streptomyces subrutilus]GGZ75906.1 hypothetical protein GCM10010371_39640 [Streptomyces subrutilus]
MRSPLSTLSIGRIPYRPEDLGRNGEAAQLQRRRRGQRRPTRLRPRFRSRFRFALARLVDAGILRPVVDTVRPLSAIAWAHHRALESGGVRGTHLIRST